MLPDESDGNDRIYVTLAEVERLALVWERSWNRPPTDEELQGLVQNYIRDEVYVREAHKLGLDANDAVIRRRLRQKLEFFIEEGEAVQPPEDAVLEAWFAQRPEMYQRAPRFSFQQIPLPGDDPAQADQALAALKSGTANTNAAPALSIPEAMEEVTPREIARTFGTAFSASLADLPVGTWSGPIRSGLGWHLVQVTKATAAQPADYTDVRMQVLRDWQAAARRNAKDAGFERLRQNYTIEIEGPQQ